MTSLRGTCRFTMHYVPYLIELRFVNIVLYAIYSS